MPATGFVVDFHCSFLLNNFPSFSWGKQSYGITDLTERTTSLFVAAGEVFPQKCICRCTMCSRGCELHALQPSPHAGQNVEKIFIPTKRCRKFLFVRYCCCCYFTGSVFNVILRIIDTKWKYEYQARVRVWAPQLHVRTSLQCIQPWPHILSSHMKQPRWQRYCYANRIFDRGCFDAFVCIFFMLLSFFAHNENCFPYILKISNFVGYM